MLHRSPLGNPQQASDRTGGALFARAVDPDQYGVQRGGAVTICRWRRAVNQRPFALRQKRRSGNLHCNLVPGGLHIGRNPDLLILAQPRRCWSNLRGQPCEQGHKGKENAVHRARI